MAMDGGDGLQSNLYFQDEMSNEEIYLFVNIVVKSKSDEFTIFFSRKIH